MATLVQDLRYCLRGLSASPGFAAIVMLTIALGTGANATVFSVMSAMLFRPPPGVHEPSTLAVVYSREAGGTALGHSSYADYQTLTTAVQAFEGLAAARDDTMAVLAAGSSTERVRLAVVSGDFFTVLGVHPAAGRLLTSGDEASPESATATAAVIGYELWQRLFNGREEAVGQIVTLDDRTYTIVGVTPPLFGGLHLGRPCDVWTPLPKRPPRESTPHELTPPESTLPESALPGSAQPASARPASAQRASSQAESSQGDWSQPASPQAESSQRESAEAESTGSGERDTRVLSIVGRLRTGVDLSSAQRQLDALAARVAPQVMTALPYSRLDPALRSEVTLIGGVVLGATGLVLLIACANVASLLLSRATSRRRELAVRFALGASRGRLIRQLLTESIAMAMGGAACGLLCAYWTADVLPALFAPEQAEILDTRVDGHVWLFTTALALVSGVTFGLAPAAQATRELQVAALRGDASGISDAHGAARVRAALVIAQVALSCILVVATGVLVRSLQSALRGDWGLLARGVAVVTVQVPHGHGSPTQGMGFQRAALERVRKVPSIQAAAWASTLPLAPANRRLFEVDATDPEAPDGGDGQAGAVSTGGANRKEGLNSSEGPESNAGASPQAAPKPEADPRPQADVKPQADTELDTNVVSAEYFATMQIPLIAGRAFDTRDAFLAPLVVIVDEEVARRYFGGTAVGRALIDPRGKRLEIVGVVASGKYRTLQESPRPMVYLPLSQHYVLDLALVVRSAGDPLASVAAIPDRLREINSNVTVRRTMTLDAHLSDAVASDRLTTVLVGACGVLAVALAMIGVYGVMTDAVVRRTREIGVRVALGARPLQVVQLVFAEALKLTTAGVLLGLVGAAAAARFLASLLHGIGSIDAPTLATIPALLLLMAITAALIPARRALRVDPIVVLRQQ